MKLPNGNSAVVDIRKLLDYCLNPDHPRDRNKARVFASVGINRCNAAELLAAAHSADVAVGSETTYGQRYTVDFDFLQQNGVVKIRSSWIVRANEELPRLTSGYVL